VGGYPQRNGRVKARRAWPIVEKKALRDNHFNSNKTRRVLQVGGREYQYFSLVAAQDEGLEGVTALPFSLKILLENLLRRHASGSSDAADLNAFRHWLNERNTDCEVSFCPTRVMMPESSGIPLLGDMAAMRDAMVQLGGDASDINPVVPVDVIVDHSVTVEQAGTAEAQVRNMALEFEQNSERFGFLRWASEAFSRLRVFPPGSGICHQINLEHLARVVWSDDIDGVPTAWPDSLIALDSHTAMINSMGIFGWGVGGLEGGAAVLGEPVSLVIPGTVGCKLTGSLRPGVTATDLVLTLTELMRRHDVVGKFVEYFGPGVDALTLQDRSTVSNMTPECGATMCFFPVDAETLRFLAVTGRDAAQISLVEAYARAQGLWRDAHTPVPRYDQCIEFDLGTVEPCIAGPGRPDKRVPLHASASAFDSGFPAGRGPVPVDGCDFELQRGAVVLAAITSCTNTSNPAVMVGAGLVARNAQRRGLKPKPWVKTSLSPGSRVVADYLEKSGLQSALDALGFNITGFGCMTCIGNSGPLAPAIVNAIETHDLACAAVLSGNRNFEGRVHQNIRANFLASPGLVIAYALAGSVRTNLESDPLGHDEHGAPVYLRDLWPDDHEIRAIIEQTLTPEVVRGRYHDIHLGSPAWQGLRATGSTLYNWDADSHFLVRPPHFEGMASEAAPLEDIRAARILGMFGDMLTTDHISPTGTIGKATPAGQYLQQIGIAPRDFVSYASRRLNYRVMTRGTFANVRLRNEMTPGIEGSSTRHFPSGEQMSIFAAAERYRTEGVALVVIGGLEYGAGSSRDWASKGTDLLGVRVVIAESFERIHRSNLVTMGVLPLEFPAGVTRKTLALDGSEVLDFTGLTGQLKRCAPIRCSIRRSNGETLMIDLVARLDSLAEVEYYRNGGIIKHVLRKKLAEQAASSVGLQSGG